MPSFEKRIALFGAGPAFAAGLALMQPQMAALAELEGGGAFLRSLAMEPGAWTSSHIALLAGAAFYLLAGQAAGEHLARRNAWAGGAVRLLFLLGPLALIGNFTLDFVYGALAVRLPAEDAAAAVSALRSDSVLQALFAEIGPFAFPLAMLVLALLCLVPGWLPRIAGGLILAGWAMVIALNGLFPYAEAIGHGVVGLGFWAMAPRLLASSSPSSD